MNTSLFVICSAILLLNLVSPAIAAGNCEDGIQFINGIDSNCPLRCDDGDECIANCCGEGEASRDPDTCGTMECERFLAGITDDSLAQYIDDLSTCNNGYEVYATFGEEWWFYILEGVATACGFDTGLSVTSCGNGIQFINGIGGNCPQRCDDGDECTANCCGEGEASRDPDTCGTMECEEFLAGITDDSLAQYIDDLSTCNTGYEVYATFGEEWWFYLLEDVATACGFDTGLSPNVCVEAYLFFGSIEEDCPNRCNGDEDTCTWDCCTDGEEERDPDTCGNVECEILLGGITDEWLEDVVTTRNACVADDDSQYPLSLEEVIYWLSGVAQQCGHEAGFTTSHVCYGDCPSPPDTCTDVEKLVSVGECANDCALDVIQPFYDELGCEFDLSAYLADAGCQQCESGARALLFGSLPCCNE